MAQLGDRCGLCTRLFIWVKGLATCVNCDFTDEQRAALGMVPVEDSDVEGMSGFFIGD